MYVNFYFNAQQGIKKFMYREDFENERILDWFFILFEVLFGRDES